MHSAYAHSRFPRFGLSFAVALGATSAPFAMADTPQAGGIEEVFVSARKRDESVQSVPISIAALSNDALEQRNVRLVEDLNTVVPGFRYGAEGGKANNNVILRGLSKVPIGEGLSAVVSYFANVALPANGSNIPMYDIAGVEVLKGPQGTLFGASALGGAVLISPVAPSYELGGYLRGAYGSKSNRTVEGAINLPLIDDKLAVRLAGQVRRQDGLQKNLSGGPDFNNTHQNSYRVSLLWEPLANLSNTLVYDSLTAPEQAYASYMFRTNPSLAMFSSPFAFGPQFGEQVLASFAKDKAAGLHSGLSDIASGGSSNRKLQGISNDTSWSQDSFTLRNIFGYRKTALYDNLPTGAVDPMTVFGMPFILFDASTTTQRLALTDELQVFGSAFDDRLEWIVGAYYSLDKPDGDNGGRFTAFSVGGALAPPVTSQVRNESRALFMQGTLNLSEWTVEGLSASLGMRYTKDKSWVCGGSKAEFMSVSECKSAAALGDTTDGIATGSTDDAETNYTFGVDWQVNPDLLLYATTRHGYRAAQVNTPIFETAYTNGTGSGCTLDGASFFRCPDLTPYQETKPEKITDYEVGVKSDWSIGSVKGRIDVAAYLTKYEDAIQFLNTQTFGIPTQFAPPRGSVGINAAELTIKGLELDLTVVPVPSLTLTVSAAFTDQDVDKVTAPSGSSFPPYLAKDVTLPSPEFAASVAASWTLPIRPLDSDLILSGDYYHTGDFSGQGGENLPGYEVANFRLSWNNIAHSGLSVATFVKNAFDEEYYASPIVLLKAFPMSVVIAGDPRTWGVEATYRF